MAAKKGYSRPGLLGGMVHYDENGKRVGDSLPNMLGGYNHYDEKGNKTGASYPSLLGGARHYDDKGRDAGLSHPNLLGGTTTYDRDGKPVQQAYPSMIGGVNVYREGAQNEDLLRAAGATEEYLKILQVPPPPANEQPAFHQIKAPSRLEKAAGIFIVAIVGLILLAIVLFFSYHIHMANR